MDVVIRGASVVDGTGAAAFVGDVAIRDGLIAYVGPSFAGSAEGEPHRVGGAPTPASRDLAQVFVFDLVA